MNSEPVTGEGGISHYKAHDNERQPRMRDNFIKDCRNVILLCCVLLEIISAADLADFN